MAAERNLLDWVEAQLSVALPRAEIIRTDHTCRARAGSVGLWVDERPDGKVCVAAFTDAEAFPRNWESFVTSGTSEVATGLKPFLHAGTNSDRLSIRYVWTRSGEAPDRAHIVNCLAALGSLIG